MPPANEPLPTDVASLLEKLRKVQSLFDAPATEGERAAAAAAAERLQARLREQSASKPAAFAEREVEFQLRLEDAWSRRLFLAMARHHGVEPYRRPGQRRTTVMVRTTSSRLDGTILPHFAQAQSLLLDHFDAIATRVIRETLRTSDAEAVERPEPKALPR